jgi:3-hydroxyisobutyrate dehydrogenase
MSVVTWIGLGKMGVPMALHLVEAGHDVRGFDLDRVAAREAEAAGIPIYSSPADAAAGADVVITMLPAGQHVHKALAGPNGLFSVASKGTLFIDFSTIGIDHAKEIHAVAEAHGQRFVDAPVSGGVTGASDGTLSFMVGGSERNFASARPFIEPIAGEDIIFHTGGPGAGQAFKVVNNLIMAVCVAVSSEGLLLAERLGLDAKLFHDVAVVSSADNFALRDWCPAPGVVERAQRKSQILQDQLGPEPRLVAMRARRAAGWSPDYHRTRRSRPAERVALSPSPTRAGELRRDQRLPRPTQRPCSRPSLRSARLRHDARLRPHHPRDVRRVGHRDPEYSSGPTVVWRSRLPPAGHHTRSRSFSTAL